MSRLIQIRDDLYERLNELKGRKESFSDVLDNLFEDDEIIEVPIKKRRLKEPEPDWEDEEENKDVD